MLGAPGMAEDAVWPETALASRAIPGNRNVGSPSRPYTCLSQTVNLSSL